MDRELEQLREARLQELRKGSDTCGRATQPEQQQQQHKQQQQQQQQQQEEMRASILGQILSVEARERLSRIALVRQEKARNIQDMLIRMAQSGQIRQKVSEPELISLLEQLSQQEQSAPQSRIVFERKNTLGDEQTAVSPNLSKNGPLTDSDDDFFD